LTACARTGIGDALLKQPSGHAPIKVRARFIGFRRARAQILQESKRSNYV
jgi:hypothetical protein